MNVENIIANNANNCWAGLMEWIKYFWKLFVWISWLPGLER